MEPCTQKENIEKLVDEIYGNGKPGLHDTVLIINEKMTGMISRQENNKIWVRGSVLTFGLSLIFLIYIGITDHNTVKSLPNNYITRGYMMQVLESQNNLNTVLEKSILTNTKDIEAIEKAIETNEKLFEYLRTTRSATTKKPN